MQQLTLNIFPSDNKAQLTTEVLENKTYFFSILKTKAHQNYYKMTYIISHYNPSVRIIDLVSHITYVMCVNFIHKWLDSQFKVDPE